MGEAALAFRSAGAHARDAGRLPEAHNLFEQAAACSRRAGDPAGEFEALHDDFDANCDRLPPREAQQLVDVLGSIASSPEQHARVAIATAHVAFVRFDRGAPVLERAALAVALSAAFDHLRSDAVNLQAMALVQAARFDEAIAASRQAVALARACGQHRKTRERSADLSYVLYEAGRIGEALTLTAGLVQDFEAAGDVASAGQLDGNLATLTLLAGDPAAALGPAQRARQRLRDMQAGASSPLVMLNSATLGNALAYLGRFGEALDVLSRSRAEGEAAAAPVRIKVQLALAHVWLLLGAAERALEALGTDDESWPEPTQAQRCWARARAARIGGQAADEALLQIGRLRRENWNAPLSQSPWLEWSRQGDPVEVCEQMLRVQTLYERAGMPGAARTALLRRIHRLGDVEGPGAVATAASLARELRPQIDAGLHASTYLPEAWCILADALARAGDSRAAGDCRDQGRKWIEQVALPNVPTAWRDSFLRRNPVNLAWHPLG